MAREKLLRRRELARAADKNEAHELAAKYVEAAKLHFQKEWGPVLTKLDPAQARQMIEMVERMADDFMRQAEKGLNAARKGGEPDAYVAPEEFTRHDKDEAKS